MRIRGVGANWEMKVTSACSWVPEGAGWRKRKGSLALVRGRIHGIGAGSSECARVGGWRSAPALLGTSSKHPRTPRRAQQRSAS